MKDFFFGAKWAMIASVVIVVMILAFHPQSLAGNEGWVKANSEKVWKVSVLFVLLAIFCSIEEKKS